MQCLHCKKRLRLFASKKRPFCSEEHEAAYHEEQSGLALRRVLDPLFTAPVKPAPIQVTPTQRPSPAEIGSEIVPSRPAPDPPQWHVLKQRLPKPVGPDLAAVDAPSSRAAPHEVPLEVEPNVSGLVQLPPTGGVLAFDLDFATQDFAPEPEPPAEIPAQGRQPIVSCRLHPKLEQCKPTAVGETSAPRATAGIDPSPLGFGLDSQPPPLRYSLASLAIGPEAFAASAQPPWYVPQEDELRPSGPAQEAKSQVQGDPAVPAAYWELPFAAARRIQENTQTEQFRWPQVPPVLPAMVSAASFRIPFAGTATVAMTLPSFPAADPASRAPDSVFPAMPRQEPIPSALACEWFRLDLLQPPSGLEPPFVFAKPPRLAPVRIQENTQTKQFRWPQAPPVLPAMVSAKSFRIPFADAATAMGPASRAPGSVPPAITLPEPISPVLAFVTPVSGCAPLDRALLQAPASLELCGIRLTARRLRPNPRELFTPRNFLTNLGPDNGFLQTSLSKAGSGPARLSELRGTWEFSAEPRSVVRANILEEIRQVEHPVQTPAMPAWAERLVPQAIFARIPPALLGDRRKRVRALGMNDFQRFRAAAHIQIREPELRNSASGDLPVPSASLPWSGVQMGSEIRPGATPVPLRPSLQTPSPR